MELTIENARMLARAAWGVSVSPPMPRYPEYVEHLGQAVPRAAQSPTTTARDLLARIDVCAADLHEARRSPLLLPWTPARPVVTQRLFTAIVSFVDDYDGAYPNELFPRHRIQALIGVIASRSPGSLDLPEQLVLALESAAPAPHPFAAALLLHGALRTLARGRDRRLGAPFDLSLEERRARGAAIAPLPRDWAPQGDALRDPLGDAYHYWGCFAVGFYCATRQDDPARWAMRAL